MKRSPKEAFAEAAAMEHLALRVAELEMELQRLRGEIVGGFTSVGVAMLETNPCAPGEVSAAIRRLAYERDVCAIVGAPTPQFNNPLAAMTAVNIRDRVLQDLAKREAGALVRGCERDERKER